MVPSKINLPEDEMDLQSKKIAQSRVTINLTEHPAWQTTHPHESTQSIEEQFQETALYKFPI